MLPEEQLDKLVNDVAEIKAALRYNGVGLIPTMNKHECKLDELESQHNKLQRTVFVLIGVLAGANILQSTALAILSNMII